jgi:hypothetical protein
MALEEVDVNVMLDPVAGVLDERGRAHLRLVCEREAGAWLLAMPSYAIGNAIAAPHFITLLRRRLGMQVFDHAFNCTLCAGVMDPFGDHALVCACGGDRTVRHNLLRDLVLRWAKAAGHAAVAEKKGLLPPRPFIGGAWENGTIGADARCPPETRRPADVYLPAWSGGRPAALDFFVTSGLQAGYLSASAADGGAATARYADRKRSHLDTATLCADAGLTFVPFGFEAEGGVGREARAVLGGLARDSARLTGEGHSTRAAMAAQALSVALQRANALAIARRAPGSAPPMSVPLAAAQDQLRFAAAARLPTSLPQPNESIASAVSPLPALVVVTSPVACGSLSCSPPVLCTTPVSGAAPTAAASPAAPPLPVGATSSATSPNDSTHMCSV